MSMDEFAELRDKAKHLAQFGCDVFVSFSLMDDYDMKKVAHDAMEVGEAYGKLLAAYDRVVLRWSDTPPAFSGSYWWRDADESPRILRVWEYSTNKALCVGGGDFIRRVDSLGGQWAGPIEQPKES